MKLESLYNRGFKCMEKINKISDLYQQFEKNQSKFDSFSKEVKMSCLKIDQEFIDESSNHFR